MADDLGFGALFGFIRVCFIGGCAVVGIAGVAGYVHDRQQETQRKEAAALVERANDSLSSRRLTPVTLSAFGNQPACDADHPKGATFIARDVGGQLVEGTLCSGPNRDNVVTLKH